MADKLETKTATSIYDEHVGIVRDLDNGTTYPVYHLIGEWVEPSRVAMLWQQEAERNKEVATIFAGNGREYEYLGKTGRKVESTRTLKDLTFRDTQFNFENLASLS